ncbi:uncharacterized protein LOC113501021 [Trichoplusia ni]|uniref:Uncharacterized protein LOC113501021 n=1 Tax=Trichoplusia ni TaxID=7111 RepID=A0A7E5WCB6_TRINI|nr:uncharacterized protein LOC113501021 [Trichoplusia ni]
MPRRYLLECSERLANLQPNKIRLFKLLHRAGYGKQLVQCRKYTRPIEELEVKRRLFDVKLEEIRRFIEDCLRAVDVPDSEARAQADLMMYADITGHKYHGLLRLPLCLREIRGCAVTSTAKPCVLNEAEGTAWVDGCNALGATVGNFCMSVAIKKAVNVGVAWVTAKRCNHFGVSSYWGMKAAKEGLIGVTFSNTWPVMVPVRAKQRALGSNPISLVCPGNCDENVVVDISTTGTTMYQVFSKALNNEKLEEGMALGPDFKITTDPNLALQSGLLLPLGGDEKRSSHKGYMLAAMVEIFCSGLAGSFNAHHERDWDPCGTACGPPDFSQSFAVIDPNCFAPGFEERVTELVQFWRQLDPVDPEQPVLAPGDIEKTMSRSIIAKGSVPYSQDEICLLQRIATYLCIRPLQYSNSYAN